MFRTPINMKIVCIRIKKRELIDLLLVCNEMARQEGDKWSKLHDKLRDQLDKWESEKVSDD